jgi:hypothetical protein
MTGREGAAASTVEAIMFAIREGDGIGGQVYGAAISALREPSIQRRLAECSNAQLRDIVKRLKAIRPRYPAITKEVISYVARFQHRKDKENAFTF